MVDSIYSPAEESKQVWVFIEQEGGVLESVSLEMLAIGRELAGQMGWKLVGLLLGHQVNRAAVQVIEYGADEVYIANHPLLEHFTIDAYASATYQALMRSQPSVFLLGATPNGRDLAGRVAVRLRTGLNADCTGLRMDAETGILVCEVSGFGGGVLALIEMQSHRPQMATVRPGVFEMLEPNPDQEGEIIRLDLELTADMIQTRIIERSLGEQVNLASAPVIVAGGRGMNGDFKILQTLADLLDGEVGATRPPVDEGHIERERQIGQTGVVCSPRVALCCGISGAFHFVVGVEKADIVIAINSDPEAPIFEHADYCIVGDVQEILPAIIETARDNRENTHA